MRDLAEALSAGVRSVRTAGVTMSVLRLALLLAGLCCLGAVQPLSTGWAIVLVVAMLGTVVLPDTVVPTLFLLGMLGAALVHGRLGAWQLITLTVGMAIVHWGAVQCSRGPLQTRMRLASSVEGGWWWWLATSVVACLALALVSHLTGGGIPGGLALVSLGVLASLAAVVAVLLLARERQP